jgi:chromosome segregation ATPase
VHSFGGTNGAQWFNDVWVYDPQTNTWAQQDCIGFIPAPREGHSAALVNDVMYIFGGRTEEGTDLGDLAAFRISSRRWYTFQNMGPSPSQRSGHSMTAHGKHIIVLAGEPSSAHGDTAELSMVYVLDTAKIRYPNDQPAANQAARGEQGGGSARRPSNEAKSAVPMTRSGSKQAQAPPIDSANVTRHGSGAREAPPASTGPVTAPPTVPPTAPIAAPGSVNRPVENFSQNGPTGSRLPRASLAQAPAGPPPQGQAPNPRTNGVLHQQNALRNKILDSDERSAGPVLDTVRAVAAENPRQSPLTSPVGRESAKEVSRASREASPGGHGRRTPTHPQSTSKAKAMEAGEAAPLMSGGPSRQRSHRSQRGQGSMDSAEEGLLGRAGSSRLNSDGAGSLRSLGDEPRSPKLTAHQEALLKELEAAKNRNAWYASELALARKAGYHSGSSSSPTFDERAVNQFGDEDKPMIEAFLTMRAELVRMQQTVEQQATSAAKRIAEVEHQRDAAVSEAAYARAKLAAHSSSPSGTPQFDTARDFDEHSERTTDMSRRLALALAAQSELKTRLDSTMNDLNTERRARELAEESTEAAQRRLSEIGQARNPMELEGLRSELLEAQKTAREEAGQRAQAEEKLRMLQIDKEDLAQRHEEVSSRLAEHVSSLEPIRATVTASAEKAELLERQLDQEREQKDELERKLLRLRADYEERTAELDSTSRRLRDAEELADRHAKEATAHRVAFFAGLSKAANVENTRDSNALAEQRIAVLQQSTDRAHAIAKSHQEAADASAQKLRAAEERIAGLEAYQEQSSREGLQIRRQLQAALKDVQSHQAEIRELRNHLETNQRDASALAVQHGALKNLLGERGINMSDARRSPMDNSPSSRFGTPEQMRLRELEQQLQSSLKAHEETKHSFESREQEADRNYREKIEQLENDYQSAVHYVKGTEKMLKRMKDELSKYKTQNSQLKSELESAKSGEPRMEGSGYAGWETQREALQRSIDDIRTQTSGQIATLEANLGVVQKELAATRSDRDQHKTNHESLLNSVGQTQSELALLKSMNSRLETRAIDAEQKVTMLLDQVGQSVGNYRRQSQIQASQRDSVLNGGANGHKREESSSTVTSTGQSSQDDGPYTDTRGSLALDNLASELDALRSHWESNTRNYRMSNQFDFERTPTKEGGGGGGGELSDSLANWRKRLEEEEDRGMKDGSANVGLKEAVPKEQGMI